MIKLYFDNHATTALDPRVLERMMPYLTGDFGNAASAMHEMGWTAKAAVEEARKHVAALIGAKKPTEVVFTSGATESIHLAIMGLLEKIAAPRHLITIATEHKSTLEAFSRAKRMGHAVTILPVDRNGCVTVEQVKAALRPDTCLVSLMHANNEVGTMYPIEEVGAMLRDRSEVAFHVDAAQTLGKHEVDVERMGIDLLSLSGHKFHGPKGIGALYIRRSPKSIALAPQMPGGGQEFGLRGGTVNVPGAVGLGEACVIAKNYSADERAQMVSRRDRLIDGLLAIGASGEVQLEINGPRGAGRLANNVSVTFTNVDIDQLLAGMKGVAFSMASACSGYGGSHVLAALGREDLPGVATMRFGLSRFTTDQEITDLIAILQIAAKKSTIASP